MEVTHIAVEQIIKAFLFILFAFFSVFLTLVLFFYFSRKKIVKIAVEKKNQEIMYQKEILQSVIQTQEEERMRIAQDLHDDISSKLNIVSLNTHLLKTPNLSESEHTEITNNIIDLTKKALENSRRIAHDLLPPVFEKFGLHAAIEELVLEFSTAKNVKINYENELEFSVLEVKKQLHIFRILQEVLNNSMRHGKATSISITFVSKNKQNTCLYIDNGVGFNASLGNQKRGIGMQNIESRVNYLGGKLTVQSEINKGVLIEFNF
ncbi:sensor histidine kinase [Flavobacterium sp. F372]|uniref:histidine kinase n=1 Tax=Flavobacterium bernardetii TaxID=2813823 RepID=A0ABR7IUJ9_9FLAO|nr:histidine kinase [Flavobacterium bernardetii]MBC5833445.1 sensor histidine kinase [Flavobacterium bernardetii]NHF68677.1 sensor histidine kinase [Flavobacterium bernardetii]